MIKNPFINALLAAVYIVVIVFVIQNITSGDGKTLLIPMTMLSLFVLSAAVMGFLFFYIPAKMFLDNQREQALAFFFKTLGTFACCVVVFVLLLLL